ncbi:gypsy retrotransposon integrase 1 [Plakobranchus ocellatus]|uniref:Gypsy retrotransposon integrase 1 n=1 Tax=Plakobranchus ocellatus TaxID=259542 RepID=A0AAV3ZF58_9GAST|nr:gypsy retrotransposon integrase 1 [Plakobranchus ocellatus]
MKSRFNLPLATSSTDKNRRWLKFRSVCMCELGKSGDDLAAWVEDKVRQVVERNDRQIERERKREEKELQKQREEIALQREREESESQRQLELELKRLELEAESKRIELGSRHNADGAGPRQGYATQRPKLPPLSDPSQVDLYLDRFERHATAFGWHETDWASCLSNLLQDEALSIFLSLSPAEGADYQSVKRVLLRRFGCDRNGLGLNFFLSEPEPYRPSARAYDKGNSRSNWSRSQRGVGRGNYPSQSHRSPSSQGYSGSGRSGTSRSPSRDRNRSGFNTRSVCKGQQFRPNSSGDSSVAASRNDVTCYQCGGKGHVRRECPSHPKEASSACSVPKLPSHCCAAKSGCDRRGKLKIESCKVFDRVSTLLRDSGCNTVGDCKSLVLPDCYNGRSMLVNTFCCKNKLFPTCIVNIQTPYFSGDVEACLLDHPIADVILGNINGLNSVGSLVLSYAHESDLAGHSGFRKTLSAIRTHFSWPGVSSDVKNYTTSCHLCQIKPRTGRDRPAPFQPVLIVGGPFERVMIDLVGPLPLSSDRYEYLLTLVDVSGLKPSRCAGLRLKMWLKLSFLFLSDLVFLMKSSQIVVISSCPSCWQNSIVCATSNTSYPLRIILRLTELLSFFIPHLSL